VLFGLGILLDGFFTRGSVQILEPGWLFWRGFSGFSLWRLRDLPPEVSAHSTIRFLVDPFYIFFGALFSGRDALVILLLGEIPFDRRRKSRRILRPGCCSRRSG